MHISFIIRRKITWEKEFRYQNLLWFWFLCVFPLISNTNFPSGQSIILWGPVFSLDFPHGTQLDIILKYSVNQKFLMRGRHMPWLAFRG